MILNLLAIGDVVGEPGLAFLEDNLPRLKKRHNVHFTVVNGENASGVGVLPRQAKAIYAAGADVVTLGNHTWNRIQIKDLLDEVPWLLRPANYTGRAPGRGCGVYDLGGVRIRVLNLIGRVRPGLGGGQPLHGGGPAAGERRGGLHPGGLPRGGHQ